MKKLLFVITLCFATQIWANNAPVVSNVTAQQRDDGSMMVDIYYDVYDSDGDAMTLTMQVSADDGVTWNFSCNNISGDIGLGM
jgi:hypothetical protein